jgi:hypothetical protein
MKRGSCGGDSEVRAMGLLAISFYGLCMPIRSVGSHDVPHAFKSILGKEHV